MTVEWNATLTANDTAVVVVSAGELIGQGLSYASFDGMDLDLNTGISGPASDKMTMIIHDGYLLATLMDGSYIRSTQLYDASGRPVRMAPADRHMAEFKLGGLSSGLYILALRTDSGTAIRKLVLQ